LRLFTILLPGGVFVADRRTRLTGPYLPTPDAHLVAHFFGFTQQHLSSALNYAAHLAVVAAVFVSRPWINSGISCHFVDPEFGLQRVITWSAIC
jgi:hypothetical protein